MRRHWRFAIPLPLIALAIVLIVWRGPDWGPIHDAFRAVTWEWVAAAIGLNLLSVVSRAVAWDTAIKQSIPPPHPRFSLVFSAFSRRPVRERRAPWARRRARPCRRPAAAHRT